MKDLLKNYVSTRRKKSLGFVPARKSVSTTRNEAFAEKYISTIRKNCFFWQTKNQQEKFFQLKLIPPNFNHGFQQQKNAANKSRLFPLDRKYVSTRRNEGFVEKYVLIRC